LLLLLVALVICSFSIPPGPFVGRRWHHASLQRDIQKTPIETTAWIQDKQRKNRRHRSSSIVQPPSSCGRGRREAPHGFVHATREDRDRWNGGRSFASPHRLPRLAGARFCCLVTCHWPK